MRAACTGMSDGSCWPSGSRGTAAAATAGDCCHCLAPGPRETLGAERLQELGGVEARCPVCM